MLKDEIQTIKMTCSDESGIEPSNADSSELAEDLIAWLLEPMRKQLAELDSEIRMIEEENRALAEQLIQLGWSEEDVNMLIRNAI